jgi:hypothetical protein
MTQHNWPLSKSEWTKQNIRSEFRLARQLLDQAGRDRDYVLSKPLSQIVRQIEQALTPEQYSLEMDDFSELSPSVYAGVLAKVKEQEKT